MLDGSLCTQRLKETLLFARERGLSKQFRERLQYLSTYAENDEKDSTLCVLYNDWAPHSFRFTVKRRQPDGSFKARMSGAFIFHDAGDSGVGQPTLSVRVGDSSRAEWSIHT